MAGNLRAIKASQGCGFAVICERECHAGLSAPCMLLPLIRVLHTVTAKFELQFKFAPSLGLAAGDNRGGGGGSLHEHREPKQLILPCALPQVTTEEEVAAALQQAVKLTDKTVLIE